MREWLAGHTIKQRKELHSQAKGGTKASQALSVKSAIVFAVEPHKGPMRLSRETQREVLRCENKLARITKSQFVYLIPCLSLSLFFFLPHAMLSLIIYCFAGEGRNPEHSDYPDVPFGGKKGPPTIRKSGVRFLPTCRACCHMGRALKEKGCDGPSSKSNICPRVRHVWINARGIKVPAKLPTLHAGSTADSGNTPTPKTSSAQDGFTRIVTKAFPRSPPKAMCSSAESLLFTFVASHEELGLKIKRIGRKLTLLNGLHTVRYDIRYF